MKHIKTDSGTEYRNAMVRKLCEILKIKLLNVKTLKQYLQKTNSLVKELIDKLKMRNKFYYMIKMVINLRIGDNVMLMLKAEPYNKHGHIYKMLN